MDISLNEQNQEHIRRKMESGQYRSPDAVIAKALELLDEHDQELKQELADMPAKVRKGTEQADAGQCIPASEVFEELRQRNTAFTKRTQ